MYYICIDITSRYLSIYIKVYVEVVWLPRHFLLLRLFFSRGSNTIGEKKQKSNFVIAYHVNRTSSSVLLLVESFIAQVTLIINLYTYLTYKIVFYSVLKNMNCI